MSTHANNSFRKHFRNFWSNVSAVKIGAERAGRHGGRDPRRRVRCHGDQPSGPEVSGGPGFNGKCSGCGEMQRLTPGLVVQRDNPEAIPQEAFMCEECWEAVDSADPITGAYGAAHVPIKRIEAH